jgi:pSer/pThr/pTyr-binding forkhead associated (FHA) protein
MKLRYPIGGCGSFLTQRRSAHFTTVATVSKGISVSRFGKLVCLNGPKAGVEQSLPDSTVTVGRAADADIVLQDQFASRHHAEIRFADGAYQVRDLGSKNGVFVNGQRLHPGGSAWLEDGAEVTFASTSFRFHDPSATVTAPALIAVRDPSLRVDPTTRQVYVDGQLLDPPLSVKQFDLLWYLYQTRGRVVSKDEIAQAVWPEAHGDVYDANIDRMISRLRSRIEPGAGEEPRFIATIRGYGYQMLSD